MSQSIPCRGSNNRRILFYLLSIPLFSLILLTTTSKAQSNSPPTANDQLLALTIDLNNNNDPILLHQNSQRYVATATPNANGNNLMRIYIIPNPSHPCVTGFQPSSSRCAIVTQDCKCYRWISSVTNQPYIDILYNQSTTSIATEWHLTLDPSTLVAPAILMAAFPSFQLDHPYLDIQNFIRPMCSLRHSAPIPSPCSVIFKFSLFQYPQSIVNINIQPPNTTPFIIASITAILVPTIVLHLLHHYS